MRDVCTVKPAVEPPRFVFFRGDFVPYDQAKVSVATHGLNYGTGCFEGMRCYWNEEQQQMFVLKMVPHFERLHQSVRILHMQLSYSVSELCGITLELIRRNAYREDVYVRPLLFMADELIGVRLHNLKTEFTMFALPLKDYIGTTGIRTCVSAWRRIDDNSVPARAKITGAYINSALAKTDAFHKGFDEAILLDADGHVSEGSAMNLFMIRHGQLVTPSVNQNILEGVTRKAVIQIAFEELGLRTEERSIDRTELYIADELFLCGTGAQIAPIVSVDNRDVGSHGYSGKIGPITERLMGIYSRAVRGRYHRFGDWLTPVYPSQER